MKMKFLTSAVALPFLIALLGCSHQPLSESKPEIQLVLEPAVEVLVDSSNTKKIKLVCSVPPAPKDTKKLQQNLKDSGVITADMSDEQAQDKVAEYIYQRQQAFKNCNK
jgi:hypothetical protein